MAKLLYIPQLLGISIEVYFIILILCLPLFFFWRWIFRKRIQNYRNRQITVWLSTIITAPMVYVIIVLLFLMVTTYYPKNNFNQKQWLADEETRYQMSQDLIDSKILIGKTKTEVKILLGDGGNTIDSDDWHYYLGYKPEIANIDPDILDITFKNGKVVGVSQHNS